MMWTSIQTPDHARPGGLRACVLGGIAALTLGLSGCGEPDDEGGGDGGGYLAHELTGSTTSTANR